MIDDVAGSMRRWAETAEAVRATRATSKKTAIVADYLGSLDAESLPLAVTFLTGRPFPERDPRRTGLGWRAVSNVVQALVGADAEAMRGAYDRSSDVGTAVGELLAEAGHDPEGPTLSLVEVAQAYDRLASARSREAKIEAFTSLLRRADPLSARYVTAILGGELRIGLREGHLEKGIAATFGADLASVQWAGMLTGDIGHTAELARDRALETARLLLFHPLKSMLASPVGDEAEALTRLGSPVWVEDKYDGIRAQLHVQGDQVRIFSRDLNDITAGYPEVVQAAAAAGWSGILDGEILAWKDGLVLPFLRLQSRLGRKKPTAKVLAATPVIYVAFDALALGAGDAPPEPLLRQPLRERRRRLEALDLPATPGFGLAALVSAADEAELERVFGEAQARGNEGLMLKDPESVYAPGRRGYAWLKLKKALTTLDCVVVGVEVGHGRRHGVLSDYTFAVLDDRPESDAGALATVGKAYTGLTDAEIAEMTRWFEAHTLQRFGRYRVVEPTVVVEIAFDVVHASARHKSGFALRFPRIVRIRDDKAVSEIDRLSTVAALHERLQTAGRYGVLTDGAADPRRTVVRGGGEGGS